MTLIELKRKVDFALLSRDSEDLEVCIPNNAISMGGISVTQVKEAGRGVDWNRGKFIIWPENKMTEIKTQ